jgi:hypothetical protein
MIHVRSRNSLVQSQAVLTKRVSIQLHLPQLLLRAAVIILRVGIVALAVVLTLLLLAVRLTPPARHELRTAR